MAEHKCTTPRMESSVLSSSAPALDTVNLPRIIPGNIASWVTNIGNGQPGESGVSTPSLLMSPVLEHETPFQLGSSPDLVPLSAPLTCRDSCADSCPSLAKVCSEDGRFEGSALSAETGAHFRELDDRLALFVLDNEPVIKNIPAEQIPTEPLTVQEKMALPFSFECAFGWSGDHQELEETPKSKETFVTKLHEAKNGCAFVQRTLNEYQMEINMKKHHRFNLDFLKKQNEAVIITNYQLRRIDGRLDEVIDEVYAVSDAIASQPLQDKLTKAYEHALPWIMRTKRVVYDNHVWYKLNYTLSAHEKPEKTSLWSVSGVGNGVEPSNGPARTNRIGHLPPRRIAANRAEQLFNT